MVNMMMTLRNRLTELAGMVLPQGSERILVGIGSLIGAGVTLALGGIDKMIYALMVLCIIDYVTGTIAAWRTGIWDSGTGFHGLIKKFVTFAIVALCNTIDIAMDTELLRQMAICGFTLNEAGSIVENVDRCGWGEYIPAVLRNALNRLNSDLEEDGKINERN